MKVLKNNYNNKPSEYPKKVICENCNSELEYEEDDMYIGSLGAPYIKCPLCGCEFMLNEEGINLTKDNIEFPKHFFHTSKDNAKDLLNHDEVKRYINTAIDYFRRNKQEFAYETGTGNLMVHVFRFDGDNDYYVVVSGDYYSTYIPFENEDY